MATLHGLATRVMGRQKNHPSARGGSFSPPPVRARGTPAGAGPGALSARGLRLGLQGGLYGSRSVCCVVPGAGLEPARPRGAARFKLAVSTFHHPGVPRGSALATDPI